MFSFSHEDGNNFFLKQTFIAGEIACFDNQRLVHGRSAYKMAEIGKSRHMESGYIDWDQATSRMRVIRERKGEEPI